MKVCSTCKFAEWSKTSNGRRHPSGTGLCKFEFPDQPLPVCMRGSYNFREATTVADVFKGMHRYIDWKSQRECATWE
jgi:hypothetical protein